MIFGSKYSCFLLCLLCVVSCSSQEDLTPKFEVFYPQSQLDELKIVSIQDYYLINVTSESGIGSGIIKLVQGPWPNQIIVRLHLKGLEGLTIKNDNFEIDKSGLSVKAYDNNGNVVNKKHLLNEKGYYEVRLPKRLFSRDTTKLTIQWVDFYR